MPEEEAVSEVQVVLIDIEKTGNLVRKKLNVISGITIVCVIILLVLLNIYLFSTLRYWNKRNIPYVKPIPFFGNLLDIFLFRCNVGENLSNLYFQLKEPVVGIFMLNTPALLLRDPNIIRQVIVENFSSFSHKTIANAFDEEINPDEATGMFAAKHNSWKMIRKAVQPAFSFLKLKNKMTNIEGSIGNMLKYIAECTKETKEVNIRTISVKYTTEVLCSVFFGMDAKCFEDENSPFGLMTDRLFNYRILSRGIPTAMFFVSPIISKILNFEFFDRVTAKQLISLLSQQQLERKLRSIRKNDYLDVVSDAMKNYKGKGNLLFTSLEVFGAGYEATAASLIFAFYELVKNPKIQRKLREEMMETIGKENEFSYDQFRHMNYLDAVVKEIFRMYPVVPLMDRVCNEDFVIENPSMVIEKGTNVYVSILGMHYDPDFFPNPHKFQPERFQDDKIKWSAYFPFGKGPKMCIAKKYSEMVIKSCIVHILTRFELKRSLKTPAKMTFNSRGFSLQSSEDIFLELHELQR